VVGRSRRAINRSSVQCWRLETRPAPAGPSGSNRGNAHPAGDETQLDWLELPDPPAAWGLPGDAHLLVGSLAHSSRWRGRLAESEDQPHLVEALDGVVRALGGCTLAWRFDRMATVCHPGTGEVTVSFASVAKHVAVRICPPRRGRRKGVVEKRPTTPPRSAGGAPCPRRSAWPRRRPAWTPSAPGSVTPGPAGWTGPTPRSARWPRPSRCCPRRSCRIRRCWRSPRRSPTRHWCRSAGTPTRCRPGWPAG
jgi:hypothetical protein